MSSAGTPNYCSVRSTASPPRRRPPATAGGAFGDRPRLDMARGFGWFESRRARSLVALVAIALMLVATNIIAARYLTARLDLTAEGLYTLSRGTRLTLAQIDEPITLRFYYSARLGEAIPAYAVY